MPGYGASAPLEPFDFDGLAAALVALLDAAGLDQAVLVGHSMGGMVALQTAAAFPTGSRPGAGLLHAGLRGP
jgi:pimeloyl-ACP methyl ester carboxylesterase